MYKLIKQEGKARRGVFETVHGTDACFYECSYLWGH